VLKHDLTSSYHRWKSHELGNGGLGLESNIAYRGASEIKWGGEAAEMVGRTGRKALQGARKTRCHVVRERRELVDILNKHTEEKGTHFQAKVVEKPL